MTKDSRFPGLRWDPKTGECQTFQEAGDVPAGWLDKHPEHPEDADQGRKAPEGKDPLPMTKAAIVEALKAGNIAYKPTDGVKVLYELLVTNLKAHLTENKVDFPDDATGPVLLALVAK